MRRKHYIIISSILVGLILAVYIADKLIVVHGSGIKIVVIKDGSANGISFRQYYSLDEVNDVYDELNRIKFDPVNAPKIYDVDVFPWRGQAQAVTDGFRIEMHWSYTKGIYTRRCSSPRYLLLLITYDDKRQLAIYDTEERRKLRMVDR